MRYELRENSDSELPGEDFKMGKDRGCYVKMSTGFAIVLLAVAISVGVGLIVHFAENRTLECNFPESFKHVGDSNNKQVQSERDKQTTQRQSSSSKATTITASTTTPTSIPTSATSYPTLHLTPSTTSKSSTSTSPPVEFRDIRLPRALRPIHYVLKIIPNIYGNDPSMFTFTGLVKIEMNCSEPTSNVTLHVNGLNVSSIQFGSTTGGGSPSYQFHTEDKDRQFLIIHLDKETVPGKSYSVEMDFVGPLKDDLKGLYLTSFQQGGITSYAVATQFEPTDARKAFPCFDEPQFKATFDVTLVRKNALRSLSNMPQAYSIPISNGMVEDHYETTVVMSTYLLAFVVGDFDYKEGNTTDGLLYRVWSRPESSNQTLTALDVGLKAIVKYGTYFDIDFPLPKQDMIAVPDFGLGAMENWGLIIYGEDAMLYEPGVSSAKDLQRVSTVVTHEVAHQWFGNLVTMEWWDDFWLNEGFARYFEHVAADFIHPDWKMSYSSEQEDVKNPFYCQFFQECGQADQYGYNLENFEQFVVNDMHYVLDLDSLVTSHPIYLPVKSPEEIFEMIDIITYYKGAAVIRMMRFILGDETFRMGLHHYMKTLSYQNANHDDLWNALSEQGHSSSNPVNVKEIMDNWILQMNYPVVRMEINHDKITIRQNRFLSNPVTKDPLNYASPFGYKWKIPFTYTYSSKSDFNVTNVDVHWLNNESAEIRHVGIQNEDWIIGNLQQYCFCRVMYDDQNWIALIEQLKTNHEIINEINRAQIIDDAWGLSRAGQLSTEMALNTMEYLSKELEYIPWVTAQRQISYLDYMLRKTDLYGQFQEFMKSILVGPFKHYGMENTNSSHIGSYIRSDIAKLACFYGIPECITNAKRLYKQWMDKPENNPTDPDLRETVYCTAISEGDIEEWDFAFRQFKTARVASQKITILKAMACTKSTWLLSRYLNLATTPAKIRKQNTLNVLVFISENPVGETLVWDFVRSRLDFLLNYYGYGAFSIPRIISGLSASFNTEFQLNQVKEFIDKNPYSETGINAYEPKAFQQAIEKIEANIKWIKQNEKTVASWLKRVTEPSRKAYVADVRLPLHLIPTKYDLTLKPNIYGDDPTQFTFDGYVKIYMEAKALGRNVTLHTKTLTIHESTIAFGNINGISGTPMYSGQRTHDDDRQIEIFYLDTDVAVGEKYFIKMNFTGPLIRDIVGFYLSQYQRGNETVYIATSHFEATYARKAFPCFDEPEMKAVFNVQVIRKKDKKSLSNMPVIGKKTLADGFEVDVYNTTARMSTYLLAFVVGDFECVEDVTTKGIKYRAWSRPELVNQTILALQTGTMVIDYYADYFGIDFPLPKQDMIAVPDFPAGAMENWGLIIYRESEMLYENGVNSARSLEDINIVIAHEVAHMWFGDLVTMNWWDDIWLNEGFATFVQYMGVDHVNPEWKMFEQFVTNLYGVFDVDSLVTSHPIYVPVGNPNEIDEIFDGISYQKGASVIRMMRFFLGEKVFQKGVQIYLRNRMFANADHNNLWQGLTEAARHEGLEIDVKGIMDTWILQMNCPVVKITKSSSGKIQLEQNRFLTNSDSVDPGKYKSPFNYTWRIPFTYTTNTSLHFNQSKNDVEWLNEKQRELNQGYPDQGEWIIGNIQQFGVYRVNYDDRNWLDLINQLKKGHKVIHVINRGQIINDAFGLAKSGQLSMDIAVQTLEYLQVEEDYVPWVAAEYEFSYIAAMLSESSTYGLFERFMKSVVTTQFERLGLNNTDTDHLTSLMRTAIASTACTYNNEHCVKEAKSLFEDYMRTKINPIDPNLRPVIYCTAIRTGGVQEWQFVFDLYTTTTVAAEKFTLLASLSCTRQPWLIYRLLELTLQPDVVRMQDAYSVYINVGSSPIGNIISWRFVRENWKELSEAVSENRQVLSAIIQAVTSTFNTDFLLQQLKDFQSQHQVLDVFSKAIETVETNILWMSKHHGVVKTWLEHLSV